MESLTSGVDFFPQMIRKIWLMDLWFSEMESFWHWLYHSPLLNEYTLISFSIISVTWRLLLMTLLTLDNEVLRCPFPEFIQILINKTFYSMFVCNFSSVRLQSKTKILSSRNHLSRRIIKYSKQEEWNLFSTELWYQRYPALGKKPKNRMQFPTRLRRNKHSWIVVSPPWMAHTIRLWKCCTKKECGLNVIERTGVTKINRLSRFWLILESPRGRAARTLNPL